MLSGTSVLVLLCSLSTAVESSCIIADICPLVARKNNTNEAQIVKTNGVHSKSVRRGCCLGETVTSNQGAINGSIIENIMSNMFDNDTLFMVVFASPIQNMPNAPAANMHAVTVNNRFPRMARGISPSKYPPDPRVRITMMFMLCAIDIMSNPDRNAVVGIGDTVSIQ
ncbi:hypothetical protein T484DRAFT_1756659 [Baffinella frigidus]|nr:hypothetical protein T484DRAFT_1756659 [Cryptophyta sp. CCMP2293]